MSERKLTQRVDLGDQHQMVLELRPAHDPSKAWGFVDTVISAEDLSVDDRWLYVSCCASDLPISGGPQMVEISTGRSSRLTCRPVRQAAAPTVVVAGASLTR